MQRTLSNQLLSWKNNPRRKPLLLRGARQVGKTYLLKEFGSKEYSSVAYFNFEEDKRLDSFFQDRLDPQALLSQLALYANQEILPEKTLIFFDEIQESNRALNSLKYFAEKNPEYPVVAAGSLLGIKLGNMKSFPVGKVDFLTLLPLSFDEFLGALGKNQLQDYLRRLTPDSALADPFHEEYLQLLREYLFVGGMPEVVASHAQEKKWDKVRTLQKGILNSYQLDFAKHAEPGDILKIALIFESIPRQLARENKKFIFSAVKKSARGREYENALQWLVDAGLIYKCHLVDPVKIPLKAYQDPQYFKIYLLDVGLLGALCPLSPQVLLKGNELFQEFKGSLTENFVAQEIKALLDQELFYWTSPGKAEVDFVLSMEDRVIPLEVKSGQGKGVKSLHIYSQHFPTSLLLRTSPRNLRRDGSFLNVPLYALQMLAKDLL